MFKVYFSHQVFLSTMSMMASSITLLSSVQDHKHLRKRRIISYLLTLVSPSPSMPAQTRLEPFDKLEMKHCHSAPGSSWLNLLCSKYSQLAEEIFPTSLILERQAPRSLMFCVTLKAIGQKVWVVTRDLEKPRVNSLMYLYASPGRTNQQHHPNNRGKAQSWESEAKIQQHTEVTYLEAGRKHSI